MVGGLAGGCRLADGSLEAVPEPELCGLATLLPDDGTVVVRLWPGKPWAAAAVKSPTIASAPAAAHLVAVERLASPRSLSYLRLVDVGGIEARMPWGR